MNKKMMRKYAALTARTGANVQKGQDVFITISAELHEFAALLAAECFKAGAAAVHMQWTYQPITKLAYKKQSLKTLSTPLPWNVERFRYMAEKLPAFIEQALEKAEGRKLCFVGDGVKTYRKAIEDILGDRAVFAPAHMSYLRPASVALLAEMHRDEAVDYLTLMPVYLRAPQAERERARKLGGQA